MTRGVIDAQAQTPPLSDPQVRNDGLCAHCHKPRKVKLGVSKQAGTNQFALRMALLDPFCESKCARAWWGCSLASEVSDEEAA